MVRRVVDMTPRDVDGSRPTVKQALQAGNLIGKRGAAVISGRPTGLNFLDFCALLLPKENLNGFSSTPASTCQTGPKSNTKQRSWMSASIGSTPISMPGTDSESGS